jgi:hypothetical protein
VTATLASHLTNEDKDTIRALASDLYRGQHENTAEDRRIADRWFVVLKTALKNAGYDGIVYHNLFEAKGRAIEWSWVAFDDNQVVRLENLAAIDAIEAEISTARPPRLRGAGPMRHHQSRGIGFFVRESDSAAFREAVLKWATDAGIEWSENYPLDYEPSFGECRPSHDLQTRIGDDCGLHLRVSSRRGEVTFQPFSQSETSFDLMKRFRSDASECFFVQGTDKADGDESVSWRPAEGIDDFSERLAAVYRDLEDEFRPALKNRPAAAFTAR